MMYQDLKQAIILSNNLSSNAQANRAMGPGDEQKNNFLTKNLLFYVFKPIRRRELSEVLSKIQQKARRGATLRGIMLIRRRISRMAPDAESKSTFIHHRQCKLSSISHLQICTSQLPILSHRIQSAKLNQRNQSLQKWKNSIKVAWRKTGIITSEDGGSSVVDWW